MSIQTGTRRQSWRQAGARSTSGGRGSVKRRQMITAAVLGALVLAALLLVAYLLTIRYQHTRVATLLTASPTITSEPEQKYTWLPLRFGSESLAPLLVEDTAQFQVASLTPSFDDAENLVQAIEEQIRLLQRDDAFIVWIRAKGAELDGQAYLFSGNYRLPESGEELADPQGAVPFKSIVEAVSQWSGPVLILLDWGNQLCDPRAGVWDNQFLSLVVEDIQAAPKQVHCLVSHQQRELSLDSLSSRQTLFGRACAEGIVGPRRLPPETEFDVWADDQLLVGDLAEYVIRRVWADSAQRQKPWLIQGQSGWLNADRQNWLTRTQMSLGELEGSHRLRGWSALPSEGEDADGKQNENEKKTEASLATTTAGEASDVGEELNDENWPTGQLWLALDGWRAPSDQLGGWSLATLAPLSAKRLATMALELEHRWLAGNDFRGEVDGVGLRKRIDALLKNIDLDANRIEAIAKSSSFATVLAERPADISVAEFSNWRQRVQAMADYRQLALILSDSVSLSDNLAKRDDVSTNLASANTAGIATARKLLQGVSTATAESVDELRLTEAVTLARELKSNRAEIDGRIAELVTQVANDPSAGRPLAELLSRYCWLSHSQRGTLLQSMTWAEPTDADMNWPAMELSLMQAQSPQRQLAIPPQRLALIEAATAGDATGRASDSLSAAEVVKLLSQAAKSLSDANRVTEATWLMVDGRDLCQKASGWPPERQLPPLPTVPQPQPGWRIAWENPIRGQLGTDRLQLHSTSEPATVDFVLTRVGAAADIESVQIELTGLQGRIAGDDGNWQRGVIKLNHDDLLRVVDLKSNAQRLPLDLRALSADAQVQLGVQIRVAAGDSSPPLAALSCRLPVDTPVELRVQQRVSKNLATDWKDCIPHENLTTLQPFPGRKNEFRLRVSNVDSQPRVATVELYRLPARSRVNAKGRISETEGEIPLELENQSLRTFDLIAKSAPITLEPNARDQIVDFTSAAAPAADPPASPPADRVTSAAAPTSAADISWGMVAVVRLESEPTRNWPNWIQLRPVRAADFLSARSTVSTDERTIQLEVKFLDADQDSLPDWTPTDFSDDQPIVLDCEIGAGIDMRLATFPMPRQILTKDKRRQVFTISSERKIEQEVELQVSVDGSARALFEFVGVGGIAPRREPPDRIKLRSIGFKDGLTYLSAFKQNYGEKESFLKNNVAMFKLPVTAPLEIVLAVDAESRGRVGARPEAVDFMLQLPTQELPIGNFFGDRDLIAKLSGAPSTTLTVECQLLDWKFSLPVDRMGDVEATFKGSIGSAQNQVLGKLVLDGSGPVLAQAPVIRDCMEGQNSQLAFQVVDSVPIGEGTITIGPAGNPNLASPLGEKLSANDFIQVSNGWQLRTRTLLVQGYPPGTYEVRAQLADVLGNASELGPWRLVVKPKPQPADGGTAAKSAQTLKADINGRLFFGALKNKSPNPVTVTVKDLPEKTVTSSDGKFRIAGLDAGEYTLEASTEWQGAVYKGEAKVTLMKKADYQKLIDISLNK